MAEIHHMKNTWYVIGVFGVQLAVSLAFFTIYYVVFILGAASEIGQAEFHVAMVGSDSEKMMFLALPTFLVAISTLIIGFICLSRNTVEGKAFRSYVIFSNLFCLAMAILHIYIFSNSIYAAS
ncbi:hypothetical protein SAMN05216203_1923 [Marinobacter daqiaonensis]|uniref:Uncharacterized protein n=1 Tax=Marinobacter daqiaonensis TaxID=650891 RepID=A0A1I6I7B3_9GAMM|nr:hypothetical protein [Marinobacter daqiaonensis]SFR62622.1 hypothetical protein SAMN05216203_1923 [Marinobacter daqiaonensis]